MRRAGAWGSRKTKTCPSWCLGQVARAGYGPHIQLLAREPASSHRPLVAWPIPLGASRCPDALDGGACPVQHEGGDRPIPV